MADPEEITIELPVDEPELEPVEKQIDLAAPDKPEPKAAVEPPVAADKIVEDLKSQMRSASEAHTQERAARERAETEARRAREEVKQARGEAVESQITAVENAIAAEKSTIASGRREYTAALASADYEKAAEINEQIALATARMVRLDEGRGDLEARKAQPDPAPRERQEPRREAPAPAADPFEQTIASVSPRAQAWLRAHPEFVTDQKQALRAGAADSMAVSEGHVRDSDAYYDYCERFLGLKSEEPAPKPAPTQRTRTAMPAAPVSRDASPSGGSLRTTQVVLSPGEQRTATDGTIVWNTGPKRGEPIGLQEMARRKAAMTKDGAYDRAYVNQ